jgi:hypothetical protein
VYGLKYSEIGVEDKEKILPNIVTMRGVSPNINSLFMKTASEKAKDFS